MSRIQLKTTWGKKGRKEKSDHVSLRRSSTKANSKMVQIPELSGTGSNAPITNMLHKVKMNTLKRYRKVNVLREKLSK